MPKIDVTIPDLPEATITLDVSKFRECFKKDSDFIEFAKGCQEMLRQLRDKLQDNPVAVLKLKME